MELATLKRKKGDGMGTAKMEVIRQADKESLGTIRYNPDSKSSCDAMELEIAEIEGKYGVRIIPD